MSDMHIQLFASQWPMLLFMPSRIHIVCRFVHYDNRQCHSAARQCAQFEWSIPAALDVYRSESLHRLSHVQTAEQEHLSHGGRIQCVRHTLNRQSGLHGHQVHHLQQVTSGHLDSSSNSFLISSAHCRPNHYSNIECDFIDCADSSAVLGPKVSVLVPQTCFTQSYLRINHNTVTAGQL